MGNLKKDKPKLALIDGDILAYKACAGVVYEVFFPGDAETDDFSSVEGYFHDAWEVFETYVNAIKNVVDDIVIVFSDPYSNFRKDIDSFYKSNRAGKPRPNHLLKVKHEATKHYRCKTIERLEGDDVLGILSTSKKFMPDYEKTIWTVDKDMKTIPGLLQDLFNDEQSVLVSPEDARKFHLLQTLMGDACDGYKGCEGFGIKTATKWLDKEGWTWASVVKAYESKGMTVDDAIKTARLAYILQAKDYKAKSKEIILWQPPQEG
jgi:DNA polymerase-1